MKITQKELKEVLDYNSDIGVFTWKVTKAKKIKVGDVAGSTNKVNNYRQIIIDSKLYQAHRLAWLYEYGEFPKHQIDHINGKRTDNRISNLRDVTNLDNQKNKSIDKRNKSGFTGVCFNKPSNKWLVLIGVNSKNVYIGLFTNIEDAITARKKANIEYGYHKNHGKVK